MNNRDGITPDNYYDYLVRTIGPNSWLYRNLTTEPWNELQECLNKYTTEEGKQTFIYIKYVERENRLAEEKAANLRRAIWSDNQEMNRLYEEYCGKLADEKHDPEILISEYEKAKNTTWWRGFGRSATDESRAGVNPNTFGGVTPSLKILSSGSGRFHRLLVISSVCS